MYVGVHNWEIKMNIHVALVQLFAFLLYKCHKIVIIGTSLAETYVL